MRANEADGQLIQQEMTSLQKTPKRKGRLIKNILFPHHFLHLSLSLSNDRKQTQLNEMRRTLCLCSPV